MLELETNKLIWEYDIPQSVSYFVNVDEECEICMNPMVRDWASPFIASRVQHDQLMTVMEKSFGFITTVEIIENHRKHIQANILTDKEIQKEFHEQMKLIESDIPKQINEKQALESLIRGLYSRKLMLEKIRDYGKEYVVICQQLNRAIELKLKMKDELKEPSEQQTLKDVIKLFKVSKEHNESRKQSVIAGKVWVRDGTRESIEYFVRLRKNRHQSSDRIDLPYKN